VPRPDEEIGPVWPAINDNGPEFIAIDMHLIS